MNIGESGKTSTDSKKAVATSKGNGKALPIIWLVLVVPALFVALASVFMFMFDAPGSEWNLLTKTFVFNAWITPASLLLCGLAGFLPMKRPHGVNPVVYLPFANILLGLVVLFLSIGWSILGI